MESADMSLAPALPELIARARADMRMGVPVVLRSSDHISLAAAAEGLSPERLAALKALGTAYMAITSRRAQTLSARAYDGDVARIILPEDADAVWIGGSRRTRTRSCGADEGAIQNVAQ